MAFQQGLLLAFAVIALVRSCTAQGAANFRASTAVVVGSVECYGCSEQNLDKRLALSGSSVAVECKTGKDKATVSGVGSVDENGSFSVRLPSSALNGKGDLASPCFARLVSGNRKLCSFANTPSSKVVLKAPHKLTTSEALSFSASSCKAKPVASHQLPSKPKPKSSPALAKQDVATQSYATRSNSAPVTSSTTGQAKTFFFAPPLEDMLPRGGPPVAGYMFPFAPPLEDMLPRGGPPVAGYMFPFFPIINTKYDP